MLASLYVMLFSIGKSNRISSATWAYAVSTEVQTSSMFMKLCP